ncbi:uncharacterized protein LOC62_01G001123 [Vanrija pseudolonga]|uniref:Right handed beta helix domain-containing protein n=1 Tax=Vanrija pseudolonga TaxID=143232 RepID=A0AAF1BIT5_9TREE|nr:hypothetical protein LOC62_01G001123 [Vanrija pseudolonga]
MRIPQSLAVLTLLTLTSGACLPNSTSSTALQAALTQGGAGYVLSLCPNEVYDLSQPLAFASPDQEISTEGYPAGSARAVLRVVGGTSAVSGTRAGLDGARLRYVQVDGNRGALPPATGAAAIEMGGNNANQLIEHVRSYDARAWSCLHVAEGDLRCTNTTVQYCDVGPCGQADFGAWADGISLSCRDSAVQFNTVTDATDGGVVVFGAPGSVVRNNTIQAVTRPMLGGINLVDVVPWVPGNYTHTQVLDNAISGGFGDAASAAGALVKVGIAIGPRVWFGDKYGANVSTGGVVRGNVLRGAFSFGIAVASADSFVVADNSFAGEVAFIGDIGPNCTQGALAPHPPTALLADLATLTNVTLTPGISPTPADDFAFVNGTASALTCFIPPKAAAWPAGQGVPAVSPVDTGASQTPTSAPRTTPSNSTATASAHSTATVNSAARAIAHSNCLTIAHLLLITATLFIN